jgi:RHS repeat-associated protein
MQNFDAWGRYRNPNTWAYSTQRITVINRGYTGHEHLTACNLINMNGRVYDPLLGMFLSPDNYVQSPTSTQNFNRYAYCVNNPLIYTDPDGEFVVAALIIGALVGAYYGGSVANGTSDPTMWDYKSGKTWGYMAGGAIVGGASGALGAAVAASGGVGSATMAITFASYTNSVGMAAITDGQTDLSVGFGAASYNITNDELGYLGKHGNSIMENVGYGLGALANISDIMAGFKPGSVELRTENDPNYNSMGTGKDLIGHSQLSDGNGNVLIDWGPTKQVSGFGDWVGGTNSYENGNLISAAKMQSNPLTISGVNTARIANYASYLNKGGQYNLAFNSCVSQTSRALNMSGVFNIGIHPYILQAQMYLRSIGARPMLYSHYLYNR